MLQVLDHSKNPCTEDIVPDTKDHTYVLYITMRNTTDFETWKVLAKVSCNLSFIPQIRTFDLRFELLTSKVKLQVKLQLLLLFIILCSKSGWQCITSQWEKI